MNFKQTKIRGYYYNNAMGKIVPQFSDRYFTYESVSDGRVDLWDSQALLYLGVPAPHVFTLGPEWNVTSIQGKLPSRLWTWRCRVTLRSTLRSDTVVCVHSPLSKATHMAKL